MTYRTEAWGSSYCHQSPSYRPLHRLSATMHVRYMYKAHSPSGSRVAIPARLFAPGWSLGSRCASILSSCSSGIFWVASAGSCSTGLSPTKDCSTIVNGSREKVAKIESPRMGVVPVSCERLLCVEERRRGVDHFYMLHAAYAPRSVDAVLTQRTLR